MYFTLKDVAEMANISYHMVRDYVRRGKIKVHYMQCSKCYHIGQKQYITVDELEKFRQYVNASPFVIKATFEEVKEKNVRHQASETAGGEVDRGAEAEGEGMERPNHP